MGAVSHGHISPCVSIAAYIFPYNSPALKNAGNYKYKPQTGRKQDSKIPQPDLRWMQTFHLEATNITKTRAIYRGLHRQGIPLSTKLIKTQDNL